MSEPQISRAASQPCMGKISKKILKKYYTRQFSLNNT